MPLCAADVFKRSSCYHFRVTRDIERRLDRILKVQKKAETRMDRLENQVKAIANLVREVKKIVRILARNQKEM